MTLGKLLIMKQDIIIYKMCKQDLVVWNRVSFGMNVCSFSRRIIPAIPFQIPPRSEILHAQVNRARFIEELPQIQNYCPFITMSAILFLCPQISLRIH